MTDRHLEVEGRLQHLESQAIGVGRVLLLILYSVFFTLLTLMWLAQTHRACVPNDHGDWECIVLVEAPK